MIFLLLQFIDFKARSWYKFPRFHLGYHRSCEFSHAMSRKIKSFTKIFLRLRRRLDHLQRIVKRTCWSYHVSRVVLTLSILSSPPSPSPPPPTQKNDNIANVLIILHYLTKLHAFMGKVKNALRIIEKRCNPF